MSLLFQAGIQSQINNQLPCEDNLWLKHTQARALGKASAFCLEMCCLICYNNFSKTKKAAQFQIPQIWNKVQTLCHNSCNFDKLIFVCLFFNISNPFSSVFQWNSRNKSLCKILIHRKRQSNFFNNEGGKNPKFFIFCCQCMTYCGTEENFTSIRSLSYCLSMELYGITAASILLFHFLSWVVEKWWVLLINS